jgi:hypothetical protein
MEMKWSTTIAVFVVYLMPGLIHGSTFLVPTDVSTIQEGLDMAGPGDTVMVEPGSYFENLSMTEGINLVSQGGPEVTTLHVGTAGTEQVISCLGVSGLVSGFTFEGWPGLSYRGITCSGTSISIKVNRFVGLDAMNGGCIKWTDGTTGEIIGNVFENGIATGKGGAICCYGCSPRIESNTFSGCQADTGGGVYCGLSSSLITGNTFSACQGNRGGGICCYSSPCQIDANTFTNCSGGKRGGGLYCHNASCQIGGNTFFGCTADFGGGVCCSDGGSLTVTDNDVVQNSAKWGGGVSCDYGVEVSIVANRIQGNQASTHSAALYLARSTVDIRSNLVEGNSGPEVGGVGATHSAQVTCEGNTFFENGAIAVRSKRDAHVDIGNCIFANTGGTAIYIDGGTGISDCNDFWSNGTDYWGFIPGPNDFYDDPLFCNPSSDDFTLEECSPCIDGYGCGQVGAYGAGCVCHSMATTPTSWSAIKSMYR